MFIFEVLNVLLISILAYLSYMIPEKICRICQISLSEMQKLDLRIVSQKPNNNIAFIKTTLVAVAIFALFIGVELAYILDSSSYSIKTIASMQLFLLLGVATLSYCVSVRIYEKINIAVKLFKQLLDEGIELDRVLEIVNETCLGGEKNTDYFVFKIVKVNNYEKLTIRRMNNDVV